MKAKVNVDKKAPKSLILIVKDEKGKVWGSARADHRKFDSGATGYYFQTVATNEASMQQYRLGANLILQGSKPAVKVAAKKKKKTTKG